MEHIYQEIPGWFSFPNLYKNVVDKFTDNSVFVEVGTWKGKSAAFMAVEIANSNKNIKFYCVDTWKGSEEHQQELCIKQDELYEIFLNNVTPVKDYITPIRKPSVDAATTFLDKSLDFIFIDAAHDYENVKSDLNAWYPKIKKGGIFAGHDYNRKKWPGVVRAVNEFCDINSLDKNIEGDTWFISL